MLKPNQTNQSWLVNELWDIRYFPFLNSVKVNFMMSVRPAATYHLHLIVRLDILYNLLKELLIIIICEIKREICVYSVGDILG